MQHLGNVTLLTFSVLLLAAFCAGLVDAIAGGGGLIQLPALLIGLPHSETAQVLGTNKLSSVFGTTSAASMYIRRTSLDRSFTIAMALPAFAGSVCGALLASRVPTTALRPVIFVLLVAVGIFTWQRPTLGHIEDLRHSVRRRRNIGIAAGGGIGFYDGIFGPGTGTFLMMVLVAALGFAFLNASAIAKIVNVSTNVGAICVFGLHGVVLWKLGIAMGAANVMGGLLGARFAIRGGSAFVRQVFLVVTAILICKVGLDTFSNL